MMIAFVMGIAVSAWGDVPINEANFPDEVFRNYILSACDTNKDGILSAEEIAGVTSMSVNGKGITDLKGIEYFTALTSLNCRYNRLTALDVSKNTALVELSCNYNQLTTLDVSRNKSLVELNCERNELTTLDVSKNTALATLYCGGNQLNALDVSKNTAITVLDCYSNQLTGLDVSNNIALVELLCVGNQLTALNVSQNTALTSLNCGSNQLTVLDVSHNTALTELGCDDNQLTALDVSNNTALVELWCQYNQLTALDVSNTLTKLYCSYNQLTVLDVSNNTALTELFCEHNQLTALDVSHNTALRYLFCKNNQLTTLDVSNCPENIIIVYDEGVTIIRGDAKDMPSITTSSLKAGTINKSYSVTLKGKGTKPLTWSATGLPSGLNCSTSGKISGKATEFGTFNVKLTLSNGAGSVTKELSLTIKGIAPKISGSLAKAELNKAYSSGLKLTKGSQPITWSVTGNLPDGLSLNTSTGVISGTPASYKSSGFKVKITASNGAGEKSKSVKLKVKGTKPKITASLPSATQGQPYSVKLTATGSQPITWTATNLPAGLSVNGDMISGTTAVKAKSYKVKLTATNPVKSVKKNVTLKVIANTVKQSLSEESYSNENVMDTQPSSSLEYFSTQSKLPSGQFSGGYIVVAELGTISADESGMYEFGIALSDDVPEGAELMYFANSDEPSDDDEIVEFYDDEGNEISVVPESRRITISIWLNKEVIYSPKVVIKSPSPAL